jgi:hypothetical protein
VVVRTLERFEANSKNSIAAKVLHEYSLVELFIPFFFSQDFDFSFPSRLGRKGESSKIEEIGLVNLVGVGPIPPNPLKFFWQPSHIVVRKIFQDRTIL